ncbi:MAG: Gfo/Idh/MocA family oxidoreductase [Kiritimatiellaeota bacterium]|nr:Gfo/Idh/MocA family oxidoreductase [Kiritimatiellota bacterium]
MKRFKVGVVGCGNISGIYFKNMTGMFSKQLEVVACADMIPERMKAVAEQYPGIKPMEVKEMMADSSIDIIVNLTIPKAHFEVSMMAVEAGKHVYAEKPMTLTREEGRKLVSAAKARHVRVANAPDTVLGGGHQTCRKLIDDGVIGTLVSATAFMQCHGHESWHPDPEFYYEVGGGPMFDMGPYYVTALVNMLGPVSRISGSARISFPERTITSEKKRGKTVKVEVPTHISGVMDFANGAIGTIITSFDVWAAGLPCIQVHGSKGSMLVPDPNGFGGEVKVWTTDKREWVTMEHTHPYPDNSRGIGVADMAACIAAGVPHSANGDVAYHVLDIMHAFHDASSTGRHVMLESHCVRPPAQPEQSRWL